MQVLSMTEFQKVCEEIAPASFIFDTGNQPGSISNNIKIISKYEDVIFMLSPNRICFKGSSGVLCFSRVKYIRYHEDPDNIGKIFSIVCGNLSNDSSDTTYVILID